MSTTAISFKAKLAIGEQTVPLASEVVFGDGESADGVKKGFLFKLDRVASDPPVSIYLGKVIEFIETKLNGGDLSKSKDMAIISKAFPSLDSSNFNSSNQTVIDVYEFTINSTSEEFLFSINVDIEGSDPSKGLIEMPAQLANWLKIDNVSISFSATTKKQTS
jgi:hypothetical protein